MTIRSESIYGSLCPADEQIVSPVYAGPSRSRNTRGKSQRMSKQRLLIIEDDADQRELIRETLDDYFATLDFSSL